MFSQSKIFLPLLALSLIVVFLFFYFKNHENPQPLRRLPYLGEKKYSSSKDTVYHLVPDFEFINQYGEKINQETVKGKIYVVDYFFTTCQSICPIMSSQMERVAFHFKNNKEVLFLSHTVNPEEDSVPVLKEYAGKHHAQETNWYFLTGDKKALYNLARKGYILNAEEGNGDATDFIHTQNFALIDKERHIRGQYDGTDSSDINRLIIDIQLLSDEYTWKKHQP